MGTFFNSWIEYASDAVYRGEAPPDETKFYLILLDSTPITRTSTIAEIITAEVLTDTGYARENVVFEAGTYSTPNQRLEYPPLTASFITSGGSIQWQSAVILADASAIASSSFTASNVNAVTDVITINAHGNINGDKLIFVPAALATLPSPLAEGTLYTVSEATTNTFKLSGINISDTGSGTFYAKNATGKLVCFGTENTTVTLESGSTQPFTIPSAFMNTEYTTGV